MAYQPPDLVDETTWRSQTLAPTHSVAVSFTPLLTDSFTCSSLTTWRASHNCSHNSPFSNWRASLSDVMHTTNCWRSRNNCSYTLNCVCKPLSVISASARRHARVPFRLHDVHVNIIALLDATHNTVYNSTDGRLHTLMHSTCSHCSHSSHCRAWS